MDYAFRLLGQRSYTIHQLSVKLLRRAENLKIADKQMACEQVVSRLKELHLLDDFTFAKRFVEERCRGKIRGKIGLNHELRRRGIPKVILDQLWQEQSLDELELARRFIAQKMPRLNSYPPLIQKRKLFSWLAARGFPLEVIRRAVAAEQALNPSSRPPEPAPRFTSTTQPKPDQLDKADDSP